MKTALRLLLSLALSAVFLWFAFRNVDLGAMWQEMTRVEGWAVVAFLALNVVIQLCRTFRWDVLIRPFVRLSKAQLFRVSFLGLMLILVLPLRLGEFGRPYLLKRAAGAPFSAGVGAVVVERAIDGLLVTLLFFLTTLFLGTSHVVPDDLMHWAVLALCFFGGVSIAAVIALLKEEATAKVVRWVGTPLAPKLTERLVGMLSAFVCGLRSLPDARAIAVCVAYTLVYWAANGWGMYLVMRGMGWDVPLVAGFTVVCVLVIGIMIPAGPGFLGTFQAAVVWGLAIFHIGPTEAAAYSMIIYPLTLVVNVGCGIPYLFGHGSDVRGVMQASAAAESGAPSS